MKNSTSKLPIVAFVLAAVFAFAFTEPQVQNDPNLKLFRLVSEDPETNERVWEEITGEEVGTDYLCSGIQSICTAQFVNDDSDIESDMINEVNGTYSPL
ncbi:DUF6520 family protein [Belliella marina]|uniref:DUF6520 family protein n=1 Tax=Belliella marina TaxID=1644146 RepID=A0ABW4VI32_9BACT